MYLTVQLSLQTPAVQTFLTQKVAGILSAQLKAKVYVDGVEFELVKTLVLRGVYVEDQRNDTLLYANYLKGDVKRLNFSENIFSLDEIILQEGKFHLKYYEGDTALNLQFIIDALSGDTTPSAGKITVTCNTIALENSQFSLDDYNIPVSEFGFDYNHIAISEISGRIFDIAISGDTISGEVEELAANERCGLVLKNLSGKIVVCPVFSAINGFKVNTQNSQAEGELLFNYNEYPDFYDFIDKVKITSHIVNADVNLSDIAYFGTALKGIDKRIVVSGNVKGTVSKLRGKNLNIQFAPNSFLRGDFMLDGLPEIDETFITLDINNLVANKRDLETIPIPPFDSGAFLSLPKNISYLGKMGFKGNFTGFINDFAAIGSFNSALGDISSDLKLSADTLNKKIFYDGKISTAGFNIGKILELDTLLGIVAGNLKVKGSGLKKENVQMNIIGNITAFDFKKYRYNNIAVEGELSKSKFNGQLAVNDKNIRMEFDGNIDFEPELPVFQFESTIENANLYALNLVKRDSVTSLSAQTEINFFGNNIDNFQGVVLIKNISYTERKNSFSIDTLKLLAYKTDTEKFLKLNSDFASGTVQGNFLTAELAPSFNFILSQILPSFYSEKVEKPKVKQQFTYGIDIFNTEKITRIFLPDLKLDKIHLAGKYNSDDKVIGLDITTPKIQYSSSTVHDFSLNLKSSDDVLTINSFSKKFNLNDSIAIENVDLVFKLTNDNVQFGYSWKNAPDTSGRKYSGSINGLASIYGSRKFGIRFLPSEIVIADSVWKFADNNEIYIDTTSIHFKNFALRNADQQLVVNGKFSETDNLHILLGNFNLANANFVTASSGIKLSGTINGYAVISHPYSDIFFSSDVKFTQLTLNNELFGNGEFVSKYENATVNINGSFGRESEKTVSLHGNYYPAKKENSLDLTADISDLNLALAAPYASFIVSKLNGNASGKIFIKGNADAPELSGKINVIDVSFLFDYLNTNYSIAKAEIIIDKNWFGFNNAVAVDAKGNKAAVTGTITHNNFKNINMDISIDAQQFHALNTNSTQNSLYYGKAYMTGLVNVSGTPENVLIEVNAKSEKGTEFFIPLSGPSEVTEHEYITFVVKDSTQKQKDYQVNLEGIQLNFKLEITPDAKIELIFDETAGDIMKARGRGNLILEINTLGNFNMYGEYVVEEGDYLFTLENIINKKFVVKNGGTITWNGNPYEGQLDLDALYKTKVLLSDLTGDSADNKRVPADCHMYMTGKIMNPEIKFGIEMPGANQEVMNALTQKTSTEQDMNKQMFSLLILNRFYPDQGGTNAGGSAAGATSSELLSNQLSNWLSQTTDIVNLGVNYRAGSEVTSQEVEVALSTQFFNNRITVEGNVGVGGSGANTTQSSNLMGDVNVEYKISNDGRFRAKVFNESNEYNIANQTQSPYTQGAGIFYREEFDTFGEFLKNMFKRKKKEKAG